MVLYLLAIVGMSFVFAWRQHTGDDCFLAGRSMGAVPLALSILANQASAVSLVGAPAFVALGDGGGLRWLQYELAVPLAMLLVAGLLLPALRSVPGASIYAYAEHRYGRTTRRALAWLAPGIPWLWWNPIGFLVASFLALAVGKADFRWQPRWDRREGTLLLGAFALMVVVLAVLPKVVALLH